MRHLASLVIFWINNVHGFTTVSPRFPCRTTPNEWRAYANSKEEFDPLPLVWVEQAETDFVDEEENLEDGEICLMSLKAFATPANPMDYSSPRFLGAGALVQRSPPASQVCDVWTADSLLDEGGPNLQLQGALKILDELLLFHLERHRDNSIGALQTFVVKCGSLESPWTCASYMAAKTRGFRPLRDLVRVSSIYTTTFYDNDLDGMVLDLEEGKTVYGKLALEHDSEPNSSDTQNTASTIYRLLPDDDTIRRCTYKRFTVPR